MAVDGISHIHNLFGSYGVDLLALNVHATLALARHVIATLLVEQEPFCDLGTSALLTKQMTAMLCNLSSEV